MNKGMCTLPTFCAAESYGVSAESTSCTPATLPDPSPLPSPLPLPLNINTAEEEVPGQVNTGRPVWHDVLSEALAHDHRRRTIGVFVCGSRGVCKEIGRAAALATIEHRLAGGLSRLVVYKETFY